MFLSHGIQFENESSPCRTCISRNQKFQSGGHSSSVTLVTSHMFIKTMIPHGLNLFRFLSNSNRPSITYMDQSIPSPYGMPEYEDIGIISPAVFKDEKFKTIISSMDISGKRVQKYAELVILTHKLKGFCGSFLSSQRDSSFNQWILKLQWNY